MAATALLVLAAAVCAPAGPRRVREAALAGGWYPTSRAVATATAHVLLHAAAVAPRPPSRPLALVVPHAGWAYSGVAAAAAFRGLRPGAFDRVVVVAPSHHAGFEGYALDDVAAYRTPLGEVPLCPEASRTLAGPEARVVAGVAGPEHAVEIELPLLQATLERFCLVPVLVGRTTPPVEATFASRLRRLDDDRTLFVFSSDFTHYGSRFDFTPFGPSAATAGARIREVDARAVKALLGIDPAGFRRVLDETGATICGAHGLSTLLEMLARRDPRPRGRLLAHYASGELRSGEADSVDYVSLAFSRGEDVPASPALGVPPPSPTVGVDAPPLDEATGTLLVELARAALETELRGTGALQRALAALPARPELDRRQGVFVTLQRKDPDEARTEGRLRGCRGQPVPESPLVLAVVRAAVDSALDDPRFRHVEARELPRLELEVSALSALRPVASWRDVRVGTHGVVLEKQGRGALFLPQVATEQGWTLEEMLDQLSLKAGLPRGAWREGARLSVMTGQVFREEEARR